jgi:hypothetical protein
MQHLDLTYKEVYPRIFVYTNLFPDHQALHKIMQKSEEQSRGKGIYTEWTDWFIFGKYCHSKSPDYAVDEIEKHVKNGVDYDYSLYRNEIKLYEGLNQSVTAAISNYIAVNNVILPKNSYISDQNIGRYNPGVNSGNGRTMQYHTDYNIGEWYWPGEKFLLTATTYMNDDYEGGELSFSVGSDTFKYKPNAGEIVVFPSGSPLYPGNEPYFHAVETIKNNSKFLVRMYLKHSAEGEQKWYDGEQKYGKEAWYKMAKERSSGHSSIVIENELKLCSALLTKLYGIPMDDYIVNNGLFYDEDEI